MLSLRPSGAPSVSSYCESHFGSLKANPFFYGKPTTLRAETTISVVSEL